ncbi:MAG: hypothetical protein JNM12_13095 [Alphaproteobacteria bacterium]|nr:hypothetical protein [Alphaproteobacteria bacterium]
MQGMKILVGVMSLMIVICIGLLAYGLATKTGELAAEKPKPAVVPPAETMTELVLPALSRIERMSGDANGAALYVESAEGDYIYFVTPATSSRIRIKRQ